MFDGYKKWSGYIYIDFFYFGFGYSMSIQLFTMFLNFVQYILHNVQCVFANCSTYFHKCSVRVRKFFSAYIPIFVLKVHRICKTFIDFEKSSRIQKRFTKTMFAKSKKVHKIEKRTNRRKLAKKRKKRKQVHVLYLKNCERCSQSPKLVVPGGYCACKEIVG